MKSNHPHQLVCPQQQVGQSKTLLVEGILNMIEILVIMFAVDVSSE
jgi:hypothetical protein